MAVQKYEFRRPDAEGAGFEERYASPVSSPVLAPDGSVQNVIHRVDDVTEFVRLKKQGTEGALARRRDGGRDHPARPRSFRRRTGG